MTIIFKGADFWIEQHEITRGNVGAGVFVNTIVTLDKSGHFVGGTCLKDVQGSVAETQLCSAILYRTVGGDQLIYGDYRESVLIQRSNGNAGGVNIGAQAIIFMRT